MKKHIKYYTTQRPPAATEGEKHYLLVAAAAIFLNLKLLCSSLEDFEEDVDCFQLSSRNSKLIG